MTRIEYSHLDKAAFQPSPSMYLSCTGIATVLLSLLTCCGCSKELGYNKAVKNGLLYRDSSATLARHAWQRADSLRRNPACPATREDSLEIVRIVSYLYSGDDIEPMRRYVQQGARCDAGGVDAEGKHIEDDLIEVLTRVIRKRSSRGGQVEKVETAQLMGDCHVATVFLQTEFRTDHLLQRRGGTLTLARDTLGWKITRWRIYPTVVVPLTLHR